MSSSALVLARAIDELVQRVPGVTRLYAAVPAPARVATAAAALPSQHAAPKSDVRVTETEARVVVSVAVTSAVPAAETAEGVSQVVRTALAVSSELSPTAEPLVHVRIAAVVDA